MTIDKPGALVDTGQYPVRPIDVAWSADSEARAVDLMRRYHGAMREHDQAISSADEMWNGLGKDMPEYARLHYMYGGRSALKCMVDALIAADVPLPQAIFDFPSAHGRVTRFLKVAFPESEVWAGDLNHAGVDFCAERFGARPFYSEPDLATVMLPRQFDLIWCGSLATHLPEQQCKTLFALLLGALQPDGILCITTCGRGMRWAHENSFKTIDDAGYEKILSDLAESPFGFAPYHYNYGSYSESESYGMAFINLEWIEKNVLTDGIQILQMREKAWHGAQDVWCFIKRPVSAWYDWAKA
jgi:SAM-dependent methyltransferase